MSWVYCDPKSRMRTSSRWAEVMGERLAWGRWGRQRPGGGRARPGRSARPLRASFRLGLRFDLGLRLDLGLRCALYDAEERLHTGVLVGLVGGALAIAGDEDVRGGDAEDRSRHRV